MYVCGPTVYNRIHIGNARTFLAFDIIRRYMEWSGLDVTFVQNVTDVDDKIIARAAEEGMSAAEVAEKYDALFREDMEALGVEPPTVAPHATKEIPAMVSLVQRLIDSEHAYVEAGDVYFSVASDPHYGMLSGRDVGEMQSGHRQLASEGQGSGDRKHDPADFALWKGAKPGEPSWDSPWGKGRPGWHIECSAMSEKYLGLPFDIHGGGADLIFPHHENECAQSRCASGTDFAMHWMHSGMLQLNSEKMSKSAGNFLLLSEALQMADARAIRLLALQTHYRSPLDFSKERLDSADEALRRIENSVTNARWAVSHVGGDLEEANEDSGDSCAVLDAAGTLDSKVDECRAAFIEDMDDDFNAPAALGEIFALVTALNSEIAASTPRSGLAETYMRAADTIVELMGVFGIEIGKEAEASDAYPSEVIDLAHDLADYAGNDTAAAVRALLDARASARAAKRWDVADAVRDGMGSLGLAVEDTPQGSRVISK